MDWLYDVEFRLSVQKKSSVTLKGGRKIRMIDIRVGDQILAMKKGKAVYSEVYGFLHKEEERIEKFLQFSLDNGNTMRITPDHLIFKANDFEPNVKDAVPASEIREGDLLYWLESEQKIERFKVNSIAEVEERGIYAPVTFAGTLVVDGVLASCYANYEIMTSHKAAHKAFAPYRIRVKLGGPTTKKGEMPRDGKSEYCKFLETYAYPVYKQVKEI